MRFYVYRKGSNAANQPMEPGPVHVATVQAETFEAAVQLASKRVTVYNGQHLFARDADFEDAEDAEIDSKVKLV